MKKKYDFLIVYQYAGKDKQYFGTGHIILCDEHKDFTAKMVEESIEYIRKSLISSYPILGEVDIVILNIIPLK